MPSIWRPWELVTDASRRRMAEWEQTKTTALGALGIGGTAAAAAAIAPKKKKSGGLLSGIADFAGDIGGGLADAAGGIYDTVSPEAIAQRFGADPDRPKQSFGQANLNVLRQLSPSASGEEFLGRLGIDSSGLPDSPFFPVRQAVDVAAAPLTWATLGAGAPAKAGIGAAIKGLGRQAAKETVIGTAGYVGQQQTHDKLPEWVPEPIAQMLAAGGAIGGGVLAHGALKLPKAGHDLALGLDTVLNEPIGAIAGGRVSKPMVFDVGSHPLHGGERRVIPDSAIDMGEPQHMADKRLWFHSTNDLSYELPDPDKAVGQSTGITQGPGIYMAADPAKSAQTYGNRTFVSEFHGKVLDLTKAATPDAPLASGTNATWQTVAADLSATLRAMGIDDSRVRSAFSPEGLKDLSDNSYFNGAALATPDNGYGLRAALVRAIEGEFDGGAKGFWDLSAEQQKSLLGRFSGLDANTQGLHGIVMSIVQNALAKHGVDALFHHSPNADGDVLIVLTGGKAARVVARADNAVSALKSLKPSTRTSEIRTATGLPDTPDIPRFSVKPDARDGAYVVRAEDGTLAAVLKQVDATTPDGKPHTYYELTSGNNRFTARLGGKKYFVSPQQAADYMAQVNAERGTLHDYGTVEVGGGGFQEPLGIGGAGTVSSPVPPAAGSLDLPEIGHAAADRAIAMKRETMQPVGAIVAKLPTKARKAYGVLLNPAASQDPMVSTAYSASQAEGRALGTHLDAVVAQPKRDLERAFNTAPPAYIGPEDNPFQGQIQNWAAYPEFYAPPSPELAAARDAFRDTMAGMAMHARTQYGVEIGLFDHGKPDAFYLPNIDSAATMEAKVESAATALSNSAKTRVYVGDYDRWKKNPDFVPESDINVLVGHNNAGLTRLSKNAILKRGAGGLSKTEVMEATHPELVKARDAAIRKVDSLRGKLSTADRRSAGGVADELAKTLEAARNAAPDEDFGPLQTALRNSNKRLDELLTRKEISAEQARNLRAELHSAEDRLHSLREAWAAAKTDGYVRSPVTNLYHTPQAANSLKQVTDRATSGWEKGIIDAFDSARAWHLSADASPSTIQTPLAIAADPVHGFKSIVSMITEHSAGWQKALQEEPERVAAFQFHTGSKVASQAPEFSVRSGSKGPSSLPKIGPKIAAAEDALFSFSQRISYEAWKHQSEILMKSNPGMSQAVADAQAAKYLGRFVPHLNLDDRGISERRAGWERVPLTSASYLTSPVLLAKDLGSGIVKLAASKANVFTVDGLNTRWRGLSGAEQLAVRGSLRIGALASVLVGGSAVLAAAAAGRDPAAALSEALTDASSRKFGALQIPGTDRVIPLPGPMRSFLRAIIPNETNDHNPLKGLEAYARTRINSPLAAGWNIANLVAGKANADWRGNKIAEGGLLESFARTLMYAGEAVEPTSLGSLSEGLRTGVDPGDIGENLISQFAGSNWTKASPTEKLNEIAQGMGAENFYALSPRQQADIKAQHPDLWNEKVANGSDDNMRYQKMRVQYVEEQKASDDKALSGGLTKAQWRAQYNSRRDRLAGVGEGIFGGDEIVESPRDWKQRYSNIIAGAKQDDGSIDWDIVDEAVAGLSAADQHNIDEQHSLGATPMVEQYKQAVALGREMRDLPKYRGFSGEEANAIDAAYSRLPTNTTARRKLAALAELGIDDARTIRGVRLRILGTIGRQHPARQRFAKANPLYSEFFGGGDFSGEYAA